jgi:hypothetical protein
MRLNSDLWSLIFPALGGKLIPSGAEGRLALSTCALVFIIEQPHCAECADDDCADERECRASDCIDEDNAGVRNAIPALARK